MREIKNGMSRFRELDGESKVMQKLRERINKVSQFDERVMILGPSGVGKETVAQQLHRCGPRKNGPFIPVCCSSVAPDLLVSEFFGYVKGAFTGANADKKGYLESADKGTLFLDEIGEMTLPCQKALLRALEEQSFSRVGSSEQIPVNFRLITATNQDLVAMVKKGTFREDLFHRLNVIRLDIPALKEHIEDVDGIARRWWKKKTNKEILPSTLETLKGYPFPGNIRELQNVLSRIYVFGEDETKTVIKEQEDLHLAIGASSCEGPEELPEELDAAIRHHVRRILEECGGNKSLAAERLKCSRNTVVKYAR